MLTAEVIHGLVAGFLKKSFDRPAEIPEFHDQMWRMCCGPHKFVAIAAPRSFAKSTAITHAYTIANIVFRERSFIVIVSDTETQSTFFLNDIKKELTENEDLMKVFGIRGLVKDTNADFIIQFDDGHEARVLAKGAEQAMRGAKWDNKRPDLIICDDLENSEMVESKERRDFFRRWFSGTLLPCRSQHGIVRVVGTILHSDSQLNRLMPRLNKKDQPAFVDDLREIANPKSIWYSARYRAHDKANTKSLWPEYKSIESLMEDRQAMIDQGHADVWAQEMLNVPYDETYAVFHRKLFTDMEPHEAKQNFNYYISTDFATSEKQRADYSVFLVAGISAEGIIHVLHVVQERMDSPTIVATMFELIRQYQPSEVFVEKGQVWNMLEPVMRHEMLKTGDFTSFTEFQASTSKRSRTSAIIARMRAGGVRFDKSKSWYPDFESECMGFTGKDDPHDDQVDTLSLLGLGLQKYVEAATPEEEMEDAEADNLRFGGFFDQGRSEVTGY